MAFELVSQIVSEISVLVGGIFGLYLISVVLNYYLRQKEIKLLEEIRDAVKKKK